MGDTYQVSEESVVGELLEKSKEFSLFYESERKNIGHIEWVVDENIDRPAFIRSQETDSGFLFSVTLKRFPVAVVDDHVIAHEIMHGIINHENIFPHVVIPENSSNKVLAGGLQSHIDSMIHDQLVYDRLSAYFDIEQIYKKTSDRVINETNPIGIKYDLFNSLFISCSYVLDRLFIEMVESKKKIKIDHLFENWFLSVFSQISSMSLYLYKTVMDIGYNSPESLERLFNKIISEYQLSGILSVLSFSKSDSSSDIDS